MILSYSLHSLPSSNDLSTHKQHIFPILARSKFEKRRYASLQELVDDLHLMFENCLLYNESESNCWNEARRLRDLVDATLTTLL